MVEVWNWISAEFRGTDVGTARDPIAWLQRDRGTISRDFVPHGSTEVITEQPLPNDRCQLSTRRHRSLLHEHASLPREARLETVKYGKRPSAAQARRIWHGRLPGTHRG